MGDKSEGIILLVEDQKQTRELMREYLVGAGYEVSEAINGAEAVKKASELSPCLIIIDLSLPVVDGVAATRMIKANPKLRNTPFIVTTASGTGDERIMRKLGVRTYLRKPVTSQQLLATVSAVLGMG